VTASGDTSSAAARRAALGKWYVSYEALADPRARRRVLQENACRPEYERAVCDLLGLTAGGEPFPTPLPGFDGCLARVVPDAKRRFVLKHVAADRGRPWLLAAVFASLVSGRTHDLRGPELSRWTIRLLAAAEATWLPEIIGPVRPPAVDEATWHDLDCYFRIRKLTDPDDAFPLSRRFVADWCGLQRSQDEASALKQAEDVIAALRRSCVVAVGVSGPTHRANPSYLYRLSNDIPPSEIVELDGVCATKAFIAHRREWRARKAAS